MKLTYQAILDDPRLIDAILVDARRDRALAVHRLIIAPLKAFFTRIALRSRRVHVQGRFAQG